MQRKQRRSRRGKWYLAFTVLMFLLAREGCVDQNLDIGRTNDNATWPTPKP